MESLVEFSMKESLVEEQGSSTTGRLLQESPLEEKNPDSEGVPGREVPSRGAPRQGVPRTWWWSGPVWWWWPKGRRGRRGSVGDPAFPPQWEQGWCRLGR